MQNAKLVDKNISSKCIAKSELDRLLSVSGKLSKDARATNDLRVNDSTSEDISVLAMSSLPEHFLWRIEQLTEVSVLKDLQATHLIALQPHTQIHFYQKGDVVMTEGDRLSPQLYTLIQGTLRLTRIGTSGKETLLRTLLPNEIFAAPALFGDAIAPATVTATIESQVLTIERAALLQQIRQTPELAFRILEIYNQRLQQMHQTIHGLVSESAIVRLANLLQRHANKSGTVRVVQGEQLNLKLSHYQIARSIGISYEECVRLLSQIKAIVFYQRGGKIIIIDRETLDAIAAGTIDLKTLVQNREARS